ncbi:DUF6610 family protein [Croceivirga sp. JEA036]|uniref:DUF6610 family protein n=1 Tax=Croceivirga sp. JEA036 TaxID=2721162 RepID=UPI00143C8072|nr:DUF6610 family protein [Croceivirga sp. JEA036]NJB35287.1 hypothetical protein [Croceivirga sp. JEA036]
MIKIVNHSKRVLEIASELGWEVGARYTNLRDIKTFKDIAFIDIDWKNYNFKKHLDAVKKVRPKMTVARDIENLDDLDMILKEAEQLEKYCKSIILVPKDKRLIDKLDLLPKKYILGYSVPSKYGKTEIPVEKFRGRKVHLLGGRPDVQRKLARQLNVVSSDCNRFTLDAKFGDYFIGDRFVKHKIGGYENCIKDSILNINKIWEDYND